MAGFGDLIKSGKDALKQIEDARKLKEQGEKEAGKLGLTTYEIEIGKPNPLATEVEKLMKKQGIEITENGVISAPEAGQFKKLITEFGKSDEVIKKGVKFDDGKIIFTKEALEHLDIKVPEKQSLLKGVTGGVDVAVNDAPNARGNGGPRQLG